MSPSTRPSIFAKYMQFRASGKPCYKNQQPLYRCHDCSGANLVCSFSLPVTDPAIPAKPVIPANPPPPSPLPSNSPPTNAPDVSAITVAPPAPTAKADAEVCKDFVDKLKEVISGVQAEVSKLYSEIQEQRGMIETLHSIIHELMSAITHRQNTPCTPAPLSNTGGNSSKIPQIPVGSRSSSPIDIDFGGDDKLVSQPLENRYTFGDGQSNIEDPVTQARDTGGNSPVENSLENIIHSSPTSSRANPEAPKRSASDEAFSDHSRAKKAKMDSPRAPGEWQDMYIDSRTPVLRKKQRKMIFLSGCQMDLRETPLLHSIKFKIVRNDWKKLNRGYRWYFKENTVPDKCWMSLRHPLHYYLGPTNPEENNMCGMCKERKKRGEPSACFWWQDPKTLRIWVEFDEFGQEIYQAEDGDLDGDVGELREV